MGLLCEPGLTVLLRKLDKSQRERELSTVHFLNSTAKPDYLPSSSHTYGQMKEGNI
jgi:hypothetical protein